MWEDPFLVREMADHAALYALPEAGERLAFLTEGGKTVTLREMSDRTAELRTNDLSEDLRRLIGRFTARGMDVIAVDQTPPEQRASGFCTYKTLIPGTIPITFGHHRRRLAGLPRLHTVPAELYGKAVGELNPHPHPFP
jgi:ribosomal protein S12 methylthiotransferase accessory factor